MMASAPFAQLLRQLGDVLADGRAQLNHRLVHFWFDSRLFQHTLLHVLGACLLHQFRDGRLQSACGGINDLVFFFDAIVSDGRFIIIPPLFLVQA